MQIHLPRSSCEQADRRHERKLRIKYLIDVTLICFAIAVRIKVLKKKRVPPTDNKYVADKIFSIANNESLVPCIRNYFFNKRKDKNDQKTNWQTKFNADSTFFPMRNNISCSNYNNRISLRLKYKSERCAEQGYMPVFYANPYP
jgi:hypothetical protein